MVFLCSYLCSILRIPTCTCVIVCTSLFHVMVKRQKIFHICLCIRLRAYSFQVRKFGSQIWPQTLVEIVGTQQLLKGLLGGICRGLWADSWLKFHPRTQPAGGWRICSAMGSPTPSKALPGGLLVFLPKGTYQGTPERNEWCSLMQFQTMNRMTQTSGTQNFGVGCHSGFCRRSSLLAFFKSWGFSWKCRA